MSGLCGWFGGDSHPGAATRNLDAMAATLSGVHGAARSASIAGCGVAVSADPAADLFQSEGVIAAMVGHPQWRDPQLAQIARTQGNARALSELFRDADHHALNGLAGEFVAVYLDSRRQHYWLAVDLMGIRPLAYAPSAAGVIFGSGLENLLPHSAIQARLDPQAIYDYLYFDMIPSPRTIYRDVHKLEPAQYLHSNHGKLHLGYHWLPRFIDDISRGTTENGKLLDQLRRAVQRCEPDARTGAFLSGGLDSSTVAGLLAEVSPHAARTYSMGFNTAGYDEIEYARAAARRFGLDAREYTITPENVVEALPQIARHYDEPFGNSSALAVYWCARIARNDGITTLLAGDGGDELFAGNERYAKQKVFELYSCVPPFLRRAILEPVICRFPGGRHIPPIRKAASYIRQANVPLPDRLQTYNRLHLHAIDAIFDPDFVAQIDADAPIRMLRATYARPTTHSSLHRMLYLDWKITLADNDLRKVNRMCQLAGIDVRYPMLDTDLVQFSTKIPAAIKLRRFNLRDYYKRELRDFLPTEIIHKPKHGFGLPFGVWLRDHAALQEMLNDNLSTFRRRGYVRSDYLDQLLHRHRTEHASFYGTHLWIFMMLEMWLQGHGH